MSKQEDTLEAFSIDLDSLKDFDLNLDDLDFYDIDLEIDPLEELLKDFDLTIKTEDLDLDDI